MSSHPPKVVLPYRVGGAWLEERILAGEAVAPIDACDVATDELKPQLRERAAALAKRIDAHRFDWNATKTVEVVGSAIHPWSRVTDESGRERRPSDPVTKTVGSLPELAQPTDSATAVIEAYEGWIERYMEASLDALAAWIDRWAVDDEPDEEGNAPNGAPVSGWIAWVPYELGGQEHRLKVDARSELELFQQAAGAAQLLSHAETTTGEDVMALARDVIGSSLALTDEPPHPEDVVAGYVDYVKRLTDVAFAQHWTRQRAREDFDQETRRWASAHGSERLQTGISDGYRMVPVYLEERISAEMPRFYAHPAIKDNRHTWRLRTGPSEEALALRRAVQDRLERYTRPGAVVPPAEIGWMKKPPPAMCDERYAYETDSSGDREGEMRECGFEVIGVRNWLTRYTLIAAVYSEADPLPDFVLLRYVLRPQDYGLEHLVQPPEGESLAENRARGSVR